MRKRTHIRVTARTHARLTAYLAVLAQGDGQYSPVLRHDPGAYVTLDQAITVLLDRDDAHRARAKKQAQSRRTATRPASEV